MKISLFAALNDAIGLSKKVDSSSGSKFSMSSKLIDNVASTIIYSGLAISSLILAVNYAERMIGIGGKDKDNKEKHYNDRKRGKFVSGTTR